ncbi:metacaspase-2 [Hydra vulgaris]|uniref:Metacaspase-2 n=1 Tax=Hydra vulgaris TaxID=6087 RepID=A0ABM4B968_HYDVU
MDDSVLPKVSRFYRAPSKEFYKNDTKEKEDEEQEVVFKYFGAYSKPYSPSFSKPLFDPIFEESVFDFDNDFRSLSVEKELHTPRSNVLQLSESFEKMKINGRYKPDYSLMDLQNPQTPTVNIPDVLPLIANSKVYNKSYTNIMDNTFEPSEIKYLNPGGVKRYKTEYEKNNLKNNFTENYFFPNYTETNYRQVRFQPKRDTFQNQRRKSLQSVQNLYPHALTFSPRLNTLRLNNDENRLSFSLDSYDLRDLKRRIQVSDLRKAYEEKLQNMKWHDFQNHERRNQLFDINYDDNYFGDSLKTNIVYKTNYRVDKSTQTYTENNCDENVKPLTYKSKWEIIRRKIKNNEIALLNKDEAVTEKKKKYQNMHNIEVNEVNDKSSNSLLENSYPNDTLSYRKKVSPNLNDQIYDFPASLSTEINPGSNKNSHLEILNKKKNSFSSKSVTSNDVNNNNVNNPNNYLNNNSEINNADNNHLKDNIQEKINLDGSFSSSSKNHVTYTDVPYSARSHTNHISTELSYDRSLIKRLSIVSNNERRQSSHKRKEINERGQAIYTNTEPSYERRYADNTVKSVTAGKHNNLKLDLKKKPSKSFFKKFQNINKFISKGNKNDNGNLFKNQNQISKKSVRSYSHSKSEQEVNMIQHERAKNAKLYTRDITLNVVHSRRKRSPRYKS